MELNYEQMLRRWRFEPNKTDADFWKKLCVERVRVGLDEHLKISEKIGWPDGGKR